MRHAARRLWALTLVHWRACRAFVFVKLSEISSG